MLSIENTETDLHYSYMRCTTLTLEALITACVIIT